MARFKISLFFGLLFLSLLVIYLPTFFHPPRSDCWTLFYFFHHIEKLDGTCKWLYVLRFDPWTQIRFQPLAYLILYLEYCIFGSNYMWYHYIHFLLYCLSILLLYKFSIFFVKDKKILLCFLSLFAFLYAHFDIVSWWLHAYIILGFCMCIGSFILWLKYLETNKKIYFLFSFLFLLLGMLCYETYFLWPFGVLILTNKDKASKGRFFKKAAVFTFSIYIVYIFSFLLVYQIKTYDNSLLDVKLLDLIKNIIIVPFIVSFQIIYNGLIVNFFPWLGFPFFICREDGNLELNYLLFSIQKFLGDTKTEYFFILLGMVSFVLIFYVLFSILSLSKIRRKNKLFILFCFYLLFSNYFILYLCRLFTNDIGFLFRQFRYNFILDAFIMVILPSVIEGINFNKFKKNLLYFIWTISLISNITLVNKGILFENRQLLPLSELLNKIKIKIKEVSVSKEKIYIPSDIIYYLPEMCWNKEMGKRFIPEGTYQWLFSPRELGYFSFTLEGAEWTINKKLELVATKRYK